MQHITKKYNNSDTLAVISLYPKKGEVYSSGVTGVASYTKNVVSNIRRNVLVLADYRTQPELYEEGNALVFRCFHNKHISMYAEMVHALRQFPNVKTVMIQFDFSLYGGMINSAAILPFLGILKILGYNVNVVSHHVVSDIKKLSGHVGLGTGLVSNIKAAIYNLLFKSFYASIGLVTNQIIVLEETLKTKLATILPYGKVTAVPHGVDTDLSPMPKSLARKKLGIPSKEYVVIFFGYVNWFKGADFFVNTFKKTKNLLGKKAHFYIAGGESVTLKNKKYYREYYENVEDAVYESENVKMTGYIPQEDIATYFSAADLVVFPYRHFMTASGVLSLVFSYQKPFIVSSKLKEMFQAPDLSAACKNNDLSMQDVLFDMKPAACLAATRKVLRNGLKEKMISMAKDMRKSRSYKNIAVQYEKVLFPTVVPSLTPKLRYQYT